jgi:hypothetical protein
MGMMDRLFVNEEVDSGGDVKERAEVKVTALS